MEYQIHFHHDRRNQIPVQTLITHTNRVIWTTTTVRWMMGKSIEEVEAWRMQHHGISVVQVSGRAWPTPEQLAEHPLPEDPPPPTTGLVVKRIRRSHTQEK